MTKRPKPDEKDDGRFHFHPIKLPDRPALGSYAPIDKLHMKIHKAKRSKYGALTKADFLEKGNR